MSAITAKELDSLEAAMLALHQATWRHRAWEDMLKRASVSLDRSEATLLKVVKGCDKSACRIQDIARYLGIEAPSVSRSVQELEQQGLLQRRPDAHDRRASNIALTPAGLQQLTKLQAAKRAKLKAALQDWPEHDRHELTRLINRLAESFITATN